VRRNLNNLLGDRGIPETFFPKREVSVWYCFEPFVIEESKCLLIRVYESHDVAEVLVNRPVEPVCHQLHHLVYSPHILTWSGTSHSKCRSTGI